MEKIDDIKYILSQLLNLSLQDIGEVVAIDKTTLSCSLDSKIQKCPYCCSSHLHSKGYYKKKYRLPFNHSNIKIVLLKIKRFKCQECHDSFSNSIGLTPRNFAIPYSTIDSIMENLKKPNETFKSTAEHFSVSETTVKRYFDKYYHPDKFNLPSVLCFDEVYIPSLNISSNYLTVLYDFEKKRLIEVISSRKKADLHRYFYHLNEKEKEKVQYVCIDMYRTYYDIARIHFKKAIICIDSFHVIKNLNDSLDKIRVLIMNQYHSDSIEYYLLKNWKFLLFDRKSNFHNKPQYNRKLKRYINKAQLFELILQIHPDLEKAYRLVDEYILFNSYDDLPERKLLEIDYYINNFLKSGIPELVQFGKLLTRWKIEICNSFTRIDGIRISNAFTEASNGTIQDMIRNAKGL